MFSARVQSRSSIFSEWPGLIIRIRCGEASAVEGFVSAFTQGVRVLFRHHLGEAGAAIAEAATRATIHEIRMGRIASPQDWIDTVRAVVHAHSLEHGCGKDATPGPERFPRRKAKAAALELRTCAPHERQMLSRYFANGEPMENLLREFHATEEEFRRLKSRLMESMRAGQSEWIGLTRAAGKD